MTALRAHVSPLKVMCMLFLFGAPAASLHVHADDAKVTRPVWVIVVTLTNRTTGKRVREDELGPEMRFDDQAQCEWLVAQAGPIPGTDDFSVVLTCRLLTSV
jgi:hypothetical protein